MSSQEHAGQAGGLSSTTPSAASMVSEMDGPGKLTTKDFGELTGATFHVLGQGGFGHTYRVDGGGKFHGKVLKTIPMRDDRDQVIRNEVAALEAAKGVDGVVNMLGWTPDLGKHDDNLCGKFAIIMEPAGERDLGTAIDSNPKLFARDDHVTEFAGQLLNTVMLLQNSGVTHNDLAPGNIMLEALPDGRLKVELVDLGLAQLNVPVVDKDGVEIGQHSPFPTSNRPEYSCPLARMRFLMHVTGQYLSGGYLHGCSSDLYAAAMCIGELRGMSPHHMRVDDYASSFPGAELADLVGLMRGLTTWTPDERWGVDDVIASPFFQKWKSTTAYTGAKMQTRTQPASRFRVNWVGQIRDVRPLIEALARAPSVGSSPASTDCTQLSTASSSKAATAGTTSRPQPPTAAPTPVEETCPRRGGSASQAVSAASAQSSAASVQSSLGPAAAESTGAKSKAKHRQSAAVPVGPPLATKVSNVPPISTASANAAVAPAASARMKFKTQRRPSAAARIGPSPTMKVSAVPPVSTASANAAIVPAAGASWQMNGALGDAAAVGENRVRTALSVLGTGVTNIFKAAKAYATAPQAAQDIPQAAAPAGDGRSRKRSLDDDQTICENNAGGGESGGRDEDWIAKGANPHIIDRTKRARRTGAHQTVSRGGVLRDKPPRRYAF